MMETLLGTPAATSSPAPTQSHQQQQPPQLLPPTPTSATSSAPLIIHITSSSEDDHHSRDNNNAVSLISDPFMGNKSAHNSALEAVADSSVASAAAANESMITHFNHSISVSKRLLSLGSSCGGDSSSSSLDKEEEEEDEDEEEEVRDSSFRQEELVVDDDEIARDDSHSHSFQQQQRQCSHVSIISVGKAAQDSIHSFSQLQEPDDEAEQSLEVKLLEDVVADQTKAKACCDNDGVISYDDIKNVDPQAAQPATSSTSSNNNNKLAYSESAPFLRPSDAVADPSEKRYKSTSEIRPLHLTPCSSDLSVATSTTFSTRSPSSKSVQSMSALSSYGSPVRHSASKWIASISRMNARLRSIKQKKNLNAEFDRVEKEEKAKQAKQTRSEFVLPQAPAPAPARHHSTNAVLRRHDTTESSCDEDCCSLDCSDISRLATSDLRTLEEEDARHHHLSSVSDSEEDPKGEAKAQQQQQQQPNYFTIDSRRMTCRHTKRRPHSIRDKKLLYGIKQFNLDPKKGIAVLENSGFIAPDDPRAVAQFLFREGRLSKKAIGKCIGGHHAFNRAVLDAFVRCHEFTHLILVQALRQFLWSFRLPGEAMQIDRIMEAFAARYCEQNPLLFHSEDTAYLLSFAIIMLNTALHNPNSRTKITVEQFVKQNREINGGSDIPRDILELIYRSIKEEPFKIPNETYDDLMYTFFSPEKEGWLMKQGGSWKNWKRRWFVLSDKCLYYFQHTAENVPKGIIPLENVKVRPLEDVDGRSYCFEVYSESNNVVKGCKTDSKGTVVQGNHKSYRMSAASPDERLYWIQCIQDSIREHPFHDIINAKKAALRRKNNHHDDEAANSSNVNINASSKSLPATPRKQHPLTPKRPLAQSAVHNAVTSSPMGPARPAVANHHRLFRGALTSTPKGSPAAAVVTTPARVRNKDKAKEENNDSIVSAIHDKLI